MDVTTGVAVGVITGVGMGVALGVPVELGTSVVVGVAVAGGVVSPKKSIIGVEQRARNGLDRRLPAGRHKNHLVTVARQGLPAGPARHTFLGLAAIVHKSKHDRDIKVANAGIHCASPSWQCVSIEPGEQGFR